MYKNGANLGLFLCLLSFFSNTNFKKKTVVFRGIWTRIVGVEGKHADHLNATTAQNNNILLTVSIGTIADHCYRYNMVKGR